MLLAPFEIIRWVIAGPAVIMDVGPYELIE